MHPVQGCKPFHGQATTFEIKEAYRCTHSPAAFFQKLVLVGIRRIFPAARNPPRAQQQQKALSCAIRALKVTYLKALGRLPLETLGLLRRDPDALCMVTVIGEQLYSQGPNEGWLYTVHATVYYHGKLVAAIRSRRASLDAIELLLSRASA
jgi:hypothetical protein